MLPASQPKIAPLFSVLKCGLCGWSFQTKEGKRWHLDTMHAPASMGVPAWTAFQVERLLEASIHQTATATGAVVA